MQLYYSLKEVISLGEHHVSVVMELSGGYWNKKDKSDHRKHLKDL